MQKSVLLPRERTGILLIDVQEKLYPHLDRAAEVVATMQKALKGFQILRLPIVVTEQYPEGLGPTVPVLRQCLGDQQQYWSKTSFSCLGEAALREYLLALPIDHWIVLGAEAHVCVLQTVKELKAAHKEVVILNDAITSRSVYNFSTAIAEMRDVGVRISSTEAVLCELVKDSRSPEFKRISLLIK